MAEAIIPEGAEAKVTVCGNGGWKVDTLARLDTGAKTSSMDTHLMELLRLEPIDGVVVKSAMGKEVRAVVEGEIIYDGQPIVCRFTVTDRGSLTHPLMLGRNVLFGEDTDA